jgi:hypothetical protein
MEILIKVLKNKKFNLKIFKEKLKMTLNKKKLSLIEFRCKLNKNKNILDKKSEIKNIKKVWKYLEEN